MQVSLESASGLERRLAITIPGDEIAAAVNKRLQEMSKRIRLDGFRPGKVPMKVVRRRYGEGARQEVLGDMIQSSYVEALKQEDLHPAGAPAIEPKDNDEKGDFEFVAVFEVYPEIELKDFSGITVKRPIAEVSDADVEEMITTLRKQSSNFETVERPAEKGDQVTFDYKGTLDGEEFEGGSAENSVLELGSGRMIPGFEEGLEGVSADEEKVLDLVFPEKYHAENLAGKAVQFACKIHKIAEAVEPEMNDEFFSRFGVKEGGMDAFRKEVSKNMDRELRQAIKGKVKNQVMEGVLTLNEIDVPTPLVNQEIDRLREQAVQQWGGAKSGFDPKSLPAELFEADAKKRVSLGLLIGEIIKKHNIEVDDSRVKTMVEEMASAYQKPQEVVDWYYKNEQQLSQVKYVVLEEQVVDTILEVAQLEDEPCSYQDAIRPVASAEDAEAKEESSDATEEKVEETAHA
ncbi:Trigger factor [invertebrate metagenome]|uniref:peptidylprolyl isomerase n=1 Tax=invertebrate metagenome TaxID=1711999 RepID=A0A2H9T7U0_9ZZZZ